MVRSDGDASVELLNRVPLFAGLKAEACHDIAAAAHVRTAEAGAIFFHEGDAAAAFYVVQTGSVKLTQLTPEGHQVVLRLIGAGEAFGGVAIYGGSSYPVTAEAVTAVTVYEWAGGLMAELLARYPVLALNTLRFVAGRLHDLQIQYRQLATEKVDRRIARALVRLVEQSGRRIERGVLIDLPLSRDDIAQMTGTTLYTVSRTVSRWEADGILELGRQRIVIRKPHALVSIADDLA
jgi:CRP/FNR family transcriptional regulator, nitrogen oxide reductase regulator